MTSVHRGLGQLVEDGLRKVPGLSWWYDPELPLALVAGAGTWTTDGRGSESPEEFAGHVSDYVTEMRAGTIFPPLLVSAVDPGPDREYLGPVLYKDSSPEGWRLDYPHYRLLNGRHRVTAAVAVPLLTFPAYVIRAGREFMTTMREHGPYVLGEAGRAARQRGRRGVPAEVASRTLRRTG